MKIIADTATLFAPCEGEREYITIVPVCVTINDCTYKDYAEISSEEFLELIEAGGVPTSSQPAVGDLLDVYDSCDEEMLVLTVGDGLSGAYQTAVGARNCAKDRERIHVVNSKTLAGPLRYMAKKAVALMKQGLDMEEIKREIAVSVDSSMSFVIPEDFAFLKRSGRLTAFTAKVGGMLKLLPILTQTEDKLRIKPISVKRTWKAAVDVIIQQMESRCVNEEYLISVCHTGTMQRAETVVRQLKQAFPNVGTEILTLSPALITHGGPGCIVVQAVKK